MGRLIKSLLLIGSMSLSGCTILTTAAAVPGFLVEGVLGHFQGSEKTYPISMRTALAASQLTLRDMKLEADLLEPQEKGGYVILFGNNKIDGQMILTAQTSELTTFNVKVTSGMSREDSVEKAILDLLQKTSGKVSSRESFNFTGYDKIREKPDMHATQLAWYHKGARLPVKDAGKKHPGWLQLKLPSKKIGYLPGSIAKSHVAGK